MCCHGEQRNIDRKEQTMIYKTQHRKIKIEHHEPHKKPGVNSGALEGYAVPDIMLFLNVVSLYDISFCIICPASIFGF
jgi:hypothetical protein